MVPEARELLDELRARTGLDLRDDVLPALGPGFGLYSSVAGVNEATPTALTAVVSVRDRAVIKQWFDRAGEKFEELAAPSMERDLQGLVGLRVSVGDEGGARWWTIEMPGLPLPFLPTAALTDRHLILSFSKTAARGAVAQATGRGDAGVGSRPEVARLAGGQAPLSVFYLDTPSLAPVAYPYADWLTTAIAAGVDSPTGRRGPGLPAIPPYNEWKSGLRPLTSVTVWEGDALVQHTEMDGSQLATMTSAAVAFMKSGAGVFALSGILAPAWKRAEQNAAELRENAQARMIVTACLVYASEHDGRFPDSLDTLVEEGLLTQDDLRSPYGPVWDGGPDYFLKPGATDSLDANELVLYSRAQMAATGETTVVFADTFSYTASKDEFLQIISEDVNAGVDWETP